MYANLCVSPLPKTGVTPHSQHHWGLSRCGLLSATEIPQKQGFGRNPAPDLVFQSLEKELQITHPTQREDLRQPAALRLKPVSNTRNLGELFVNKKINHVLVGFITDSLRNWEREPWQTPRRGCASRPVPSVKKS